MKKLFFVLTFLISVTCFGSQSWAKKDCLKTMEYISYGVFNNCYGSYTFDNRDRYVGEWINDQPHGQGIYTYSNGKIEEGIWKEGLLVKAQKVKNTEENSKEISKNITNKKSYHSSLLPCQPSRSYHNCYGIKTFKGGHKYEGEWQDNKENGKGTLFWNHGDIYEGEFKNGRRNGFGTETYVDGNKYVGEWKDSSRHGKATFTWKKSGDKFVGNFKNDKRNGKGVLYFGNGNIFEGEYKNNKIHGFGIYTYANGAKFEGEFKNNKQNGFGKFIDASGKIITGIWKDGKFQNTPKMAKNIKDYKKISSNSTSEKIYLDCNIIQGSTGTNLLEVIISKDEVCMGDTTMSPECAKVDGSIPKWKKNTGMYATVNVSENEYKYVRFFGNKIGRIISLNRMTGRATHTQLDDAMNQDVSVFKCKRLTQKKLF